MIQRIQTIWMFIAAVAVFLTLQFSFFSGTLISDNSFYSFRAKDNFILMVLTSALGTAIIINIFLFKHRSLQFKICVIAILAECLIIFLYLKQSKQFSNWKYDLWAIFHLVIFIALILAMRGIYKDNKLIRDSNRLR